MKRIKLVAMVIVMVLTMVPCSAFAADKAVNVTVDGVPVQWTDARPYVDENNRTMVPLAAIGEAMGISAEWDQELKMAIFGVGFSQEDAILQGFMRDMDADGVGDVFLGATVIGFRIGQDKAPWVADYYLIGGTVDEVEYRDENFVQMDTEPVIKDGRTYAPVKYLAEYFGYKTEWNNATKTVVISTR